VSFLTTAGNYLLKISSYKISILFSRTENAPGKDSEIVQANH
jgi:hypothetical protein